MGMLVLLKKYRKEIMGFAALWIVAFHVSFPMLYFNSFLYDIELAVKRLGFCGVDIFLFLSGMGLVYSIQKSTVTGFYIKRIERIIVPYVLMGIFTAILENWTLSILIKNIFFYYFWFENIYSSLLWFVPMIFAIYMMFPLYFYIFKKSSNKIVFTVAILILWLTASLCFRNVIRNDLWAVVNRIPIFVVGVMVGWLSQHIDIVADRLVWSTLLMTLILGIILAYLTNYRDYYVLVPSSNCFAPTFLLTISLCFLIPKVLDMLMAIKQLRWIVKILNFYGGISIELYCIQEYLVSKFLYKLLKNQFAGVLWDLPLNGLILLILTVISVIIHSGANQMWKYINPRIKCFQVNI